MLYWNQENREGLQHITEALREDGQLGPIAEYCDLRVRGLRKQALGAATAFVSAANQWPRTSRREAVDRLLRIQHEHPGAHQFMPHPVVEGLILPTLEEWTASEPSSAVAWRWLGVVTGDGTHFERALSLDAGDDVARNGLVANLLRDVNHATHHLGEGQFIGDEGETAATLRRARSLLDASPHDKTMTPLRSWCEELEALLLDWAAFCEAPSGSFVEWCRQRGHHHEFPTIVYYDR